MTDAATENGQLNFGPPHEPVIPPSECSAALELAERLYDNILERGDMPKEVLEWIARVWEESRKLRSELCIDSTVEDSDAVLAAAGTALLPTFHHGSSQKEAGAALLSLIGVGTKYGWMIPQEEPTQTGKRESAQPAVLSSTSTTKDAGPSGV